MSNNVTRAGRIGNSLITIGRFTYGFENISVKQWGEGASLQIGSFCSIANPVTIFLGGNHRTDWITTFPFGHIYQDELGNPAISGHPSSKGDVSIGHDVWIGSGVTIMSGVTIGTGAVLAANSTVIKDVQPYEIVGGNPAKAIKKRFDNGTIELLMKLSWWNLPLETIREICKDLSSPPDTTLLLHLIEKYRQNI